MSITIERVVEATSEVHELIGELNDVLGAAYEADQRHNWRGRFRGANGGRVPDRVCRVSQSGAIILAKAEASGRGT
jgi:hypothetical protein